MRCHIHFKFPDGSRIKNAFSYDWRLWTLPEVQELLAEAGFDRITVYWQGTDEETGEANGEFEPASCRGAGCGVDRLHRRPKIVPAERPAGPALRQLLISMPILAGRRRITN